MSQTDEFREFFLHSARGHLQVFSETILQLERTPGQADLIQKLMFNSHSLKAESAGMGFAHLEGLGNAVEELFTALGQGTLQLTSGVVSALLAAFDFIERSLNSIELGGGQELDSQEAISQLKKAVIVEAASGVRQLYAASQENRAASTAGDDHTRAITLSTDKLDHLVKVGEELAMIRVGLLAHPATQTDEVLRQWVSQLDKVATEYQSFIMRISLFPVSIALYTLPRLVRDTAVQTGKQVRLEVSGDEVTVDRMVIHHLTEMLVHLVRNAIDHGVEPAAVRREKGKPEEAVLRLNAWIKEKHLYVSLSDDGAGIDWEALAAKAKEKGFYTTEELTALTEEERHTKLLFTNQLSTSEGVTTVSGRGVGLGAVSAAVQKLDGTLSVASERERGTTFTICLPIALEVVEAFIVRIGGRPYALPTDRTERVLTVAIDEVLLTKEGPYLEIEGTKITLFDLESLLKIEGGQAPSRNDPGLTVAIIRQDSRKLALLIETVEAKEEVIVKPLESSLVQGRYFSGVTVLDSGAVVPIVKVANL